MSYETVHWHVVLFRSERCFRFLASTSYFLTLAAISARQNCLNKKKHLNLSLIPQFSQIIKVSCIVARPTRLDSRGVPCPVQLYTLTLTVQAYVRIWS